MKYKDYKKGSSALRRIINDEELEFSRQFAIFHFNITERGNRGRPLRGIWNVKTKNIIGFVNHRGNVFIRPTSVYAGQLLGAGTNKVIKHTSLRNLRNKVGSHTKNYGLLNLCAENAVDRLIENGDTPNKVYLFKFPMNMRADERWLMNRMQELLKKKKLPNTLFALNENSLVAEQIVERNEEKVYLQIEDYSEAIAQRERLERIKTEIAEAFIGNIREIAHNAIITQHSLNPIQFTYTVDGEEQVTGRIKLNRLDLAYPPEMPISEWLRVDDVARQIVFEERLGSLAERGIDELAQREERNIRQGYTRISQSMYQQYHDFLASNPGGVIRVPRMPSTAWTQSSENTFTASYAQEYDEITRADLEAMAMPMPEVSIPNDFWGDPDEATPMTSA